MKNNIKDDYIDLTITSPPYDDLRSYNGFKFDYKTMLEELYRVTKPGGVVVWVVNDRTNNGSESGTSFKHALYAKETGFNLHDTMIYAKNNPVPLTHNRYEQAFEYVFVFSKGKPKSFNPITIPTKYAGELRNRKLKARAYDKDSFRDREEWTKVQKTKIKSNIWYYNMGMGNVTTDKIAYKHPAIFPEELAQDHILSWSNIGDIILDPMCGSGTVCKMAKVNERNYIGIDTSEKYINEICIPRLRGE